MIDTFVSFYLGKYHCHDIKRSFSYLQNGIFWFPALHTFDIFETTSKWPPPPAVSQWQIMTKFVFAQLRLSAATNLYTFLSYVPELGASNLVGLLDTIHTILYCPNPNPNDYSSSTFGLIIFRLR